MVARSPTELGRLRPATVVAGGVAAALGATAQAAPQLLTGGPVLCPFRRLTGEDCPGCGLTRSAVALLHGDAGESFRLHPFGPVLVAALAVMAVMAVLRWARPGRPSWPRVEALRPAATAAGAAVAVAWAGWYATGLG